MERSVPNDAVPRPTRGKRAADALVAQVYEDLRSLARRYLRYEAPGHTLQATALVHEAYLRLSGLRQVDWQGETHFRAVAATQMRRALVDHARAAKAAKRGHGAFRVTLNDGIAEARGPERFLDLSDALADLENDPRQERVAELRLFSGLEFAEIAQVIGKCERTVRQDWTVGRAWLARRLRKGGGSSA